MTIKIDPHGMTDGQVQNREKRLPPANNKKGRGSKMKYYPIHVPTHMFRLELIVFVACAVADFFNPINYILTDNEYYGIPVSYRAKWTILLVVICVITIIATMKCGCHHHVYRYESSFRGANTRPVYFDVLSYLVLACMLSYLCNWLIPNLYVMRLFIYIVIIAMDILIVLCCI